VERKVARATHLSTGHGFHRCELLFFVWPIRFGKPGVEHTLNQRLAGTFHASFRRHVVQAIC
jgi:hypothetical protein